MKDIYYHILNSAIAGGLLFLGSLIPLLTDGFDWKTFSLGSAIALITGLMLFLSKFNDWLGTQDPCPKLFQFI
jgi:hypothetical protein